MKNTTQNSIDGLTQENIDKVAAIAPKMARIVGTNLSKENPVMTLDQKINGLNQKESEFVRDMIVEVVSDIKGIETFGAVTSGGKMVFTYVPDQVCDILSEKSDKHFGNLSDRFKGVDDVNLSGDLLA